MIKTYNGAQAGKLSFVRVLRGEIGDGATLNDTRVGGIFKMMGHTQNKVAKAVAGDVVALGRLEDVKTGTALSASGKAKGVAWPAPLKPVTATFLGSMV